MGVRVVVIGATGTIGRAVVEALSEGHDVLGASRRGDVGVDIEDRVSITAFYGTIRNLDAVVCCAGTGRFGALAQLSDADFQVSLRSKLMGQVNLVRLGLDSLRDGGSFTLTSGILSTHPTVGGAALSMVNGGLESFVRAAALELPRGLRVNIVSPPWVAETLVAMGRDPSPGMPAAEVARAYVELVEGSCTGEVRRLGVTLTGGASE